MTSILQRISHSLRGTAARETTATDGAEAKRLHDELALWTAALPRGILSPAGSRCPEYLNPEMLLGKGLPHASRLRDGAVLMASPGLDEALRFAHACVEHRISHVVDLRSAKEKQHGPASPLDGGKTAFAQDHGVARFARSGRERPLKGAGPEFREDHARSVEVSLKPGKKSPAPAGRATPGLSQSLEWVRVHVGSDKAIAPQRLLDISLHLAHTASSGRTAFQCADGLHTGATFAAAHALMQTHLREPLSAEELKEAVLDVCVSIRRDRGPELFREKDLASLMAFGRLLLAADRDGKLRDVPRPAAPVAPPVRTAPQVPPRETAPPEAVTRTFEPPPTVSLRSSPQPSVDATREQLSLPRSILKHDAPRIPGGERPRVTFAKETSVRYVTEQASGDASDDSVTPLVADFQRTVLEGNLTVPRRIGREANGEAEAFPDEPGHGSTRRDQRKPRKPTPR
jgi:hypothetical protein